MLLPPLLPIDDVKIERSETAHSDLHLSIESSEEPVGALFRAVQQRYLLEAAATTRPIWSSIDAPVIVARRRFLPAAVSDRLAGVNGALHHLDTRMTMVQMGSLDHVVAQETPYVLNAFAEGHVRGEEETNAGSIRVTKSSFLDVNNVFKPPAAEYCREMLAAATNVVRSAPVAPLTAGAWMALAMFAIHPFVDGNGRTARLLFHATHSASLTSSVDWGSVEMWALDRERYLTAIQASVRSAGNGQLELVDPVPFFDFVAECSIEGANRCKRRLAALEWTFGNLRSKLSADAALIAAFVWSERNVRYSELEELPLKRVHARSLANELLQRGVLIHERGRGLNPVITT